MGTQQSEWQAPPNAADRENPVPANIKSVAAGKTLFNSHCASCHGINGKGSGLAADLTSPPVQNQTDGALFWKISQGRSMMPGFANTLTSQQKWDVINYIRTLASEPAQNSTTTLQPGIGGGMQGSGMMRGNMTGSRDMMINSMSILMSSSSLVATQDGGVIVLMGNELSKYDKDLNLVNQVEIKFNWENWQKMMEQRLAAMTDDQGG
jgi:mono/diheme cytochrome c family protein